VFLLLLGLDALLYLPKSHPLAFPHGTSSLLSTLSNLLLSHTGHKYLSFLTFCDCTRVLH
jgi:hypothetical protein